VDDGQFFIGSFNRRYTRLEKAQMRFLSRESRFPAPRSLKAYIRSKLDTYFDVYFNTRSNPFARKTDIENMYIQLAAFMQLREFVGPHVSVCPFGGSAMYPDALLPILEDISSREAPRIVEFGGGESTIAIAATLKRNGQGRLLTVEHDPAFARRLSERLERLGLSDRVDLRVVPMSEHKSFAEFPTFVSYDLCGIDESFDVALVDGPIVYQFGDGTRIVPVSWCLERLKEGRAVYLDDAHRPQEKAVIAAIKKLRPDVVVELSDTQEGLCKFSVN
jgi:predicted O-methyltransferase YrrM